MELPISSIVVGVRSRREMRNIDTLAESIRERGCLHPPVVRQDGRQYLLVAGARRLAAMQALGFDQVTVTLARSITDEIAALHAEGEENTERDPFTPSEAVAHAERIEGLIAKRAKDRMLAGTKPEPCADSPQGSVGRTRDRVAKATGMSHPKLAEARRVVEAAKDETLPAPVREVARQAVEEMDRTGNVHGAHAKVERAKTTPIFAPQRTDEEQRQWDEEGRRAKNLEQFCSGQVSFRDLQVAAPDRRERILARLVPSDRQIIEQFERDITWKI